MNMTANTTEKSKVAEELGSTIAIWSLSTSETIVSELFEFLYDKGLTRDKYFDIHMEILTFFLLNFQRFAVDKGGEKLLKLLHAETADSAIRMVLVQLNSYRDSNLENTVQYALDYYNRAAVDYDCCQVLVESTPDYEGERTVIGKLSARIAKILNEPFIAEVNDLISVIATEALAESGLKNKVEKLSAALI